MFRIKICGITTVSDARLATTAGADAIGLNFYPSSPRYVSIPAATEIGAGLTPGVRKVGLFVNAALDDVRDAYDRLKLDLVQLHGDESPEYIARLKMTCNTAENRGSIRVMRAFRGGPEGLAPIVAWLDLARRLSAQPDLVLLDAWRPGLYGGTGNLADWDLAREYLATSGLPPLVLAGGLTPENVGQAVVEVRPYAVDTASGVESAPGRKDPTKITAFVAAARAAFG